jgi:23S rRNA (pseudouridine1915-N3)-methyltransferase
MRISILHIGKTRSKALADFGTEFIKRCQRFGTLEAIAVAGVKGKNMNPEEVKRKEATNLLQRIAADDQVILLDERGKSYSSLAFAEALKTWSIASRGKCILVIGGAYGHGPELLNRANASVSLSALTFNHELALAVCTEQVYRAMTILAGHPYHNE